MPARFRNLRRRFNRMPVVGGSGMLVQHLPSTPRFHDPAAFSLSWSRLGIGVAIVAVVVAGAKLGFWLTLWSRRKLRAGRRRRRRHDGHAEARARTMMSELCPHGWRARITLFSAQDELPPEAPDGMREGVALDWAALPADPEHEALVRRVWAPSIAEALERMLADRRTDVTLEDIELAAGADGALWPES